MKPLLLLQLKRMNIRKSILLLTSKIGNQNRAKFLFHFHFPNFFVLFITPLVVTSAAEIWPQQPCGMGVVQILRSMRPLRCNSLRNSLHILALSLTDSSTQFENSGIPKFRSLLKLLVLLKHTIGSLTQIRPPLA